MSRRDRYANCRFRGRVPITITLAGVVVLAACILAICAAAGVPLR